MTISRRINDQIRAPRVRVVGSDGKQLGIMETVEAVRTANEQDLDLVLISPLADPPVCKIIDYGKFRYDLEKKEKQSRKGSKIGVTKELKMSPRINEHDYLVRCRQAKGFLEKKCKVKILVNFRGREAAHPDIGLNILNRLADEVKEVGELESAPRLLGYHMIMMISPK